MVRIQEVVQPQTTHYDSSSRSEGTIDGFFIASPSWMAKSMRMNFTVLKPPYKMFTDKLSDHSVVRFEVRPQVPKEPGQRSAPSWVSKDP
eukprot:10178865-Karenia_brevis.AAC.1